MTLADGNLETIQSQVARERSDAESSMQLDLQKIESDKIKCERETLGMAEFGCL